MAEVGYLWKNRAQFPIGSKAFVRAWGKRILSLHSLISRNLIRWRLVNKGAQIHPCAEIGDVIADGNKANLTIGAFSFVGRAELALHEQISIGNFVCINDGVRLLTGSHDISDPLWRHIKKPIIIDDYAWIATDAIILPGVRIGRGAVVGAGAVVTKEVHEGEIVIGNPAKPISKKRTENLTYNPCEMIAANRAWIIG
ncbi:MAG: acyltransferase [Bacteroidota bacterium]